MPSPCALYAPKSADMFLCLTPNIAFSMNRIKWAPDTAFEPHRNFMSRTMTFIGPRNDVYADESDTKRWHSTCCPHRTSIYEPRFRFLLDLIPPSTTDREDVREPCARCNAARRVQPKEELRDVDRSVGRRGSRFGHPLGGSWAQLQQFGDYGRVSSGRMSRIGG